MALIPMPGKGYPDHDWNKKEATRPPQTPADPFTLLRPFLQSWTVGFDQQFEYLQQLQKAVKPSYPPYNIKEIEEGCCYEIEMAVAGFSKDDISITLQDGQLLISGKTAGDKSNYVHKGIAARSFEQSFALAEYVEVVDAKLDNGMLIVTLEKNLPEDKKPKVIEIS